MNTVERRRMTPWVKWLAITTYVPMASVLLAAGPGDQQAFLIGVGMLILGVAWICVGEAGINRAFERTTDVLGAMLGWLIVSALKVGVPLEVLYSLVRFVKWAWTD